MVTKDYLNQLNIEPDSVPQLSKSALKKMVKTRIRERMQEIVLKAKDGSTKMRFSTCNAFESKPYIKFSSGNNAVMALKTKLNMWEIYGNYKGNYKLPI